MSKRSRSSVKSHSKDKSTSKRAKSLGAQVKKLRGAKLQAARTLANAATMGFLGIEKKFLDTYRAESAIASVAGLSGGEYDPSGFCTGCLSCPAQGDNEQQRDGKHIVIDSLILKGHVDYLKGPVTGGLPVPAVKVFVAVVLDTQTNGAQMNSEDCFKNVGGTVYTCAEPLKNLLSGKRFRILKSQTFDLTPNTLAVTSGVYTNGVQREFDWYIPFKGGLPVNMNAGTTADVANVIDNSLHVIAFSNYAGAEGPQIAYNARIRFQG